MRPLVASGVVAAVIVLLVVLGAFASDLLLSDTSSAYALDAEPGDYLQVDGVVTEVSEGDEGLRFLINSEGGQIFVDVTEDTAVLQDDQVIDAGLVKVGQRLAVSGLVNDHRRIGAAVLSIQGDGDSAPTDVQVDERNDIDGPVVGHVVLVKFDRSHHDRGQLILRLPDGKVVAYAVNGETLADFITDEGFAPGSEVTLGRGLGGNDRFSITPSRHRGDPCEEPFGQRDFHGQETFCGIVMSRDANLVELQTRDGVVSVEVVRDTNIIVLVLSGLTREEAFASDAIVGHGVQVTGHERADTFIAGQLVVGPKADRLPPPAGDQPPSSDRR